jgi:hypothetical protein
MRLVQNYFSALHPNEKFSGYIDITNRLHGMGELKITKNMVLDCAILGNFAVGKLQGIAEKRWNNGCSLIGRFKFNKDSVIVHNADGAGIMTFINGDVMKGNLVGSGCHGSAMYTYSNGDVRYGAFDDDKWHGTALHIYQDGRKELQTWNKGEMNSETSGLLFLRGFYSCMASHST